MFRQLLKINRVTFLLLFCLLELISNNNLYAQIRKKSTALLEKPKTDSLTLVVKDTVLIRSGSRQSYRWQDRYLNSYAAKVPQSPFYLKDSKNIITDFKLSPNAKEISIIEKVGKRIDYKVPQAITFNEYSSIQNASIRRSIMRDYENLQDGKSAVSGRGLKPLLEKKSNS